MRRRNLCCVLAALVLMMGLSHASMAQSVLGSIEGYITDDSGAALPGVTVTITNTENGIERSVVTNGEGLYSARSLNSGLYNVTAALEGMQTVTQEGVQLRVGQKLAVSLSLGVESVAEAITVTGESPVLEVGRSSAASYVSEEEIASLPISGRDFKEFAFLTPTVQNDPVRGFITMSGQRGIYSGLNIDGTSGKSAFFGYGRGGEATENDGLVIAQDSVKEFQVIVNGFAPEYGANGGGYINVVTKSGTNNIKGTGFLFYRDESLAEDIPASDLDRSRGNGEDTPVDAFERMNYGFSFGGPIQQDKTHFFFSADISNRDEPFSDTLNARGAYDAVLLRAEEDPAFAALIEGYVPNDDGIAAADPINGRTARGTFLRTVDNLILFGKLDQQVGVSNTLSGRINYTDYERTSDFADEESDKAEKTLSLVGSLVSVVGGSGVNEARLQYSTDDLDRLSGRVGEPIEAQIRFRGRDDSGSDSLGKFDFLPIFVEEKKLQFQDSFSYLFGEHDLKFGVDYQKDDLSQLFAGSADGRYDFDTIEDFVNNEASTARIYFGDRSFPNYDEEQELYAFFAQDSWRPNPNLTVSYGFRYGATINPDNLPHIFDEGTDIPDDTDNFAPRVGFAYSVGGTGRDVLRGGVGLFYSRTPSLLFANQVQENGLFPNFGRVNVSPGDTGFVPLGESIDNENPPEGTIPSPGFVDPSFEDPETLRFNLGYERQLATDWTVGVDAVYAEGENLQSNIDINRTFTLDEFGRPFYDSTRPDPNFNTILTRQSIGESEYTALTFKVAKRFSDRYQMQAHYTWSEDRDTDSNERSATGVTVSNPDNIRYDWGPSERDVENRFVFSGLVILPLDFKLSGIVEYRSGRPFDPTDSGADFAACGFTSLGFNCTNARPVVNGRVLERNSFTNDSVSRVDLRVSKLLSFSNWQVELFGEVFNVLDENSFEVAFGFNGDNQRDPTNDEFGLGDNLVTSPRQIQLGARLTFN